MSYDNIQMLNETEQFMAFVDRKKADWYIRKNLAEWSNSQQTAFRLKFTPQGDGKYDLAFYKIPAQNICVVCGTDQNLTRHHIVPSQFRRAFPYKLKSHSCHDVLSLCCSCHNEYERCAELFKAEIRTKYGIPSDDELSKIKTPEHEKSKALYYIIKYSTDLEEINRVRAELDVILAKQTSKNLRFMRQKAMKAAYINCINQIIAEDGLVAFIESWRQHFLDHAKPMFMPEHWAVQFAEKINKY